MGHSQYPEEFFILFLQIIFFFYIFIKIQSTFKIFLISFWRYLQYLEEFILCSYRLKNYSASLGTMIDVSLYCLKVNKKLQRRLRIVNQCIFEIEKLWKNYDSICWKTKTTQENGKNLTPKTSKLQFSASGSGFALIFIRFEKSDSKKRKKPDSGLENGCFFVFGISFLKVFNRKIHS